LSPKHKKLGRNTFEPFFFEHFIDEGRRYMIKGILYFICGLSYFVPAYFVLIFLSQVQFRVPFMSLFCLLLFFIIPVFLLVKQWGPRRVLSVGLIVGTVLIMPVLFFQLYIDSQKIKCAIVIRKVERYKKEHGEYPVNASLIGGEDYACSRMGCARVGNCDYGYSPSDKNSYSVGFRIGPGMQFIYPSSLKKWRSVVN
jgi:hypothetical protein